MHRREVGLVDFLGQGGVLHDVPDVPLHGLPGYRMPALLVLPVVGRLQVAVSLLPQRGLPALVPLPDKPGQALVLQLRLVHLSDALHVVRPLVQVLQLNLAPQQPAHLHLVVLGQQVPGRCLLVGAPGLLQLAPHLRDFLLGGGSAAAVVAWVSRSWT